MLVSGEFGYLCSAVDNQGTLYSVKVVSKKAAVDAHREQKMANERLYLSSLEDECAFIPSLVATCQDEKVCRGIVYNVCGCCVSERVILVSHCYV